jgi:hypothetical protein
MSNYGKLHLNWAIFARPNDVSRAGPPPVPNSTFGRVGAPIPSLRKEAMGA